MKTSNLRKLFWVFFALIVTTSSVFSQGWRNGNTVQNNQNQSCLQQISNLSKEQVQEIEKLEKVHQESMTELRTQRRSTINAIEKSEIRTEMLKKVAAHQNEVKNLLSAEQQQEYEMLHNNGRNFRNQRFAQNVNGRNRGYGNFASNGNNGCRGRGYNAAYGQNSRRGNNCFQNNVYRNGRNRNYGGANRNSNL
jgi:hypothetical protein